jgi:hypothetical protein
LLSAARWLRLRFLPFAGEECSLLPLVLPLLPLLSLLTLLLLLLPLLPLLPLPLLLLLLWLLLSSSFFVIGFFSTTDSLPHFGSVIVAAGTPGAAVVIPRKPRALGG